MKQFLILQHSAEHVPINYATYENYIIWWPAYKFGRKHFVFGFNNWVTV